MTTIENIDAFVAYHQANKNLDFLGIGQRFCNMYIKNEWPELYYQEDYHAALNTINMWLEEHQYINSFPKPIERMV